MRMKKPTFQNSEIKQMGDKVLSAIRLSDTEIDHILDSPELFSKIRETVVIAHTLDDDSNSNNRRSVFYNYRWQLSIGCCVILITLAVGFTLLTNLKSSIVPLEITGNDGIQYPPTKEEQKSIGSFEEIKPPAVIVKRSERIAAANIKTGQPRRRRISPTRGTPAGINKSEKQEMMGEFQFLTFDADTALDRRGRIVRVELPRASLFAMGVNIPPENGKPRVKSDLYIGSDGIMKAVRIARIN